MEKTTISLAIRKKIEHVFSDLGSDELLNKCLHGRTQNANEAINQIIWQKCPKRVFVERFPLECGVASAVIYYNNGYHGLNNVFQKLRIDSGICFRKFATEFDKKRIDYMDKKSTHKVMNERKRKRHNKKGFEDKNAKKGVNYEAGGF